MEVASSSAEPPPPPPPTLVPFVSGFTIVQRSVCLVWRQVFNASDKVFFLSHEIRCSNRDFLKLSLG